MKINHPKYITSFILGFMINLTTGFSAPDCSLSEIEEALNSAATYTTKVLLDDEGKSRCDYNMTEGTWYPYEEPWHTGQLILGLVESYRVTQEESYLNSARKAGNWWISLAITEPGKLQGMLNALHGDAVGDIIIFATVSDGTEGLYELYKETGVEDYARVPSVAAKWMLDHMCLLDEGVCYDGVNPATGEILTEKSAFWKRKERPELNDLARPNTEGSLFKDAWEYNGDETLKDAFLILCDSLVEKQDEYGLWMDYSPNDKERGTYHPRFNLWYAESLLEAYKINPDPLYIQAAKRTVDRYLSAQLRNGTIHYRNYVDGSYDDGSITGSAVAFLGLLMIELSNAGFEEAHYAERIELCLNWIMQNRFSDDHPDPNLRGATLNLRVRNRHGKKWVVNRDVGTAFAMRFLAAAHQYYQKQDS